MEINKDEARRKFEKKTPEWNEKNRRISLTVTPEMLKTIISMYPTHKNMFISARLNISNPKLSQLLVILRKSGVKLEKITNHSIVESIEILKKTNPDYFS